jgi:hypothetical protein
MVDFIVFCLSIVAGVVVLSNVIQRFRLHRITMGRWQALALAMGEVTVAVAVRVKRAVEYGLWELAPEFMHWSRDVATAAEKAVVAAQWGGNPPAPKAKAGKKKPKPAVVPVSELPSMFPSFEARKEVSDKLYAEWKTAATQRDGQKYGTPEYTAAKATADQLYDNLMAAYSVPVRY